MKPVKQFVAPSSLGPGSSTFENIACTVCGCVCDDLQVSVADGAIAEAQGACELAAPWFQAQQAQAHEAQIDGEPASVQEALAHAAKLLAAARYPLIFGLSRSATQGQRAAVALADRLGATIDTTASLCHAPSVMALQVAGESTCTLGEVRNRADLVIYWGCDPLRTHPRHHERYAVLPAGRWIDGRASRTVVLVNAGPTDSEALADQVVRLSPGGDFEALARLRALVRGLDVSAPPELADLAGRMRRCRFGVVFFGLGLSQRELGHRNVEALLRLVAELNDYTRFYARRLRMVGDVAGADTVLAWQTGYPFSVNLGRGYPRYNPGEFSAMNMLERGEPDLCLFVGSESVGQFTSAAAAHLRRIPVIALDYPSMPTAVPAAVRFTTAVYGIHAPGTVYRMDEVPIPLRPFLPASYPTDEAILTGLLQRLPEMGALS